MNRVAVAALVTAWGLAMPRIAMGQVEAGPGTFDPDSPFSGFPRRYVVERCVRDGQELAGTILQSGSRFSLRPHGYTQAGLFSDDRPSREPELAFVDTRGKERRFQSHYHRYPFGVRQAMKEEVDITSGLDPQGGFLESATVRELTTSVILHGIGWTTGEFGRTTRTKRFFRRADVGTSVVVYESREVGYTRASPAGGTQEVNTQLTCILRPLD